MGISGNHGQRRLRRGLLAAAVAGPSAVLLSPGDLLADVIFTGPDGASFISSSNFLNGTSPYGAASVAEIGDGAGVIDTSAGGVGAVFDPANQTPGTLSYTTDGLYLIHASGSTTTEQSSRLTIDSGTLNANGTTIIGRYGNDNTSGTGTPVTPTGYVTINGGTLTSNAVDIDLSNGNGSAASGTVFASGVLNLVSGGLVSSSATLRIANEAITVNSTAGSTAPYGEFFNRADGSGTISLAGMQVGAAANSNGILEIHDGASGVTPINVSATVKIADVALNVLQSNASLNFVLDSAPALTSTADAGGNYLVPANVDLINATTEQGFFTTIQGSTVFAVGSTETSSSPTVTASYGGNSYTWTLDYKAVVSGGLVTATTGGNDIALLGQDSTVPVPEPATIGVIAAGSLGLLARRRHQRDR